MKIEIEYKHLMCIKTMLAKKCNEFESLIKEAYSDADTPLSEINRLNEERDSLKNVLEKLKDYN
jgi:uncharacterized protein Yka (UPF0111/DUF47 family)